MFRLLLAALVVLASCTPSREQAPPTPTPAEAGGAEAPAARPVERAPAPHPLSREAEIRRTAYGVPHILAESLRGAGFGLAWVMMEDYGEEVPRQLLEANGRWATVAGAGEAEGDFSGRLAHDFAAYVMGDLPQDVRAVLEGFAAGVNSFIVLNRETLPDWVTPEFSPVDVATKDIRIWDEGAVRDLMRLRSMEESAAVGAEAVEADPNDGSNAWAFGPERTVSGEAILVRNPHLSYTAGYYEAHITVPGVLNFYGDFRLGGPFGVIGGFNDRLGWSTTNNNGNPDQVYSLLKDPENPDAYLFDGASNAIRSIPVTVEFLEGDSLGAMTREFRFTPLGPVLLETRDTLFVLKTATLGQARIGEQWLRMMQARTLDQWKAAMRIRAKYSSNFTYADADGNIFYVWNASVPVLPHPPSDGAPVFAAGRDDVWTDLFPWDSLPQLLNPPGGYIQNSNDPPYYTNLNAILPRERYPANFPEPRLRFRTQNSLELVHSDRILTLEDVVRLKHSMKMMLADRVKDDLVEAVRSRNPSPKVSEAIQLVEAWDNLTARESRGGALFELWASQYFSVTDEETAYREAWSPDDPTGTPLGLGDPAGAAEAFGWAVEEAETRFGAWDVSWGEVHRIRAGELDIPVGGCPSTLGCFRVIGYASDDDGKFRARTGDGWVLAVEFGDIPRAYSVLVYGNSNQEDSPLFYNQAEMFANNTMKPVAFTEEDILRTLVERYRPGEDRIR